MVLEALWSPLSHTYKFLDLLSCYLLISKIMHLINKGKSLHIGTKERNDVLPCPLLKKVWKVFTDCGEK